MQCIVYCVFCTVHRSHQGEVCTVHCASLTRVRWGVDAPPWGPPCYTSTFAAKSPHFTSHFLPRVNQPKSTWIAKCMFDAILVLLRWTMSTTSPPKIGAQCQLVHASIKQFNTDARVVLLHLQGSFGKSSCVGKYGIMGGKILPLVCRYHGKELFWYHGKECVHLASSKLIASQPPSALHTLYHNPS